MFYLYWARVLRKFGSDICNHLRRHKLDGPGPYALYAYSYGALELLEYAKEAGYFSVLNQIDLSMVELEIVAQERLKWPGWETPLEHICKTNFERLKTEHSRAEWSKANLIVVNSEWSKQALVGDSVPAEKIVVVPLAYEPEPGVTAHVCENVDRPLNILWIGQVNLRKGIPYLIEAAKLLPSVRFTVAGPVFVNENMLKTAPKNTQFIGRVNRAQAHKLYSDADVFVLPTISDGFALTQLEAMAHGLPVIATLRCGKVVTDGVDGLIIPFGDSAMLAGAIAKLDQDRKLISELSRNAPAKAAKFTLEACANAIEAAAHP
ncbi:MAG TPA: glycosyltransferase family 4 protein [Phycisphaerae bacterium]|nr:glycosyltransferase family 4 protein [Phycisphaerae bacterium]